MPLLIHYCRFLRTVLTSSILSPSFLLHMFVVNSSPFSLRIVRVLCRLAFTAAGSVSTLLVDSNRWFQS